MLRHSIWVLAMLIVFIWVPGLAAQENPTMPATTNDYANFRTGPELSFDVIRMLEPNTPLTLNGRRADSLWLRAVVDGTEGWIFYSLVNPAGDLASLAVVTATTLQQETSGSTNTANIDPSMGEVNSTANFRTGPSTAYPVIQTLATGTSLSISGRNRAITWLQVSVGETQGWIYRPLVSVYGDPAALALREAPPLPPSNTRNSGTAPASTGIVSNLGARTYQIYQLGQQLGNRANVFSKVGDSISTNPNFMYPIGVGGLRLGGYAYLQATVDFFSTEGARTHNSFANDSIAVRSGWVSGDVLNPANATSECLPNESPLACEYRIVRPSIALIMFGTNDILRGVSVETYRSNLQRIIDISAEMGVIPVLSTIPDILLPAYGSQVATFNTVVRSVALNNGTPLWDYWAALQALPGQGIGGDGYHPSFDPTTGQTGIFDAQYLDYGYNMRNYTGLVVLDTLRRQVIG